MVRNYTIKQEVKISYRFYNYILRKPIFHYLKRSNRIINNHVQAISINHTWHRSM
jgi:hypothetical protein